MNDEEYRDAADYDCEHGAFGGPGADFYTALARQTGGPILELACGTGRVAIPMARDGFAVIGIDLMSGMIEQARIKSEGLKIRWLIGDCRDFHLDDRFRLIFLTGHGFQAFLDRPTQEAMLARAREHLQPDGLFAFESRNPVPEHLETDLEETYWHTYTGAHGHPVRVSGTQTYDPVRQVQRYTTYRRWMNEAGAEVTRTSRIDLRYVYPQEMEALLHDNGFAVEQCYGNWDRSPFAADSREMIYICRKRP